jgi:hypothetical protein
MKNVITKAFFAVSAFLVAQDFWVYWSIQHKFQDRAIIPIILLGILAHFAFERKAAAE